MLAVPPQAMVNLFAARGYVLTCDLLVTYIWAVDKVFKALADANRRRLLDKLFARDGQTLFELCRHCRMTRFGTMKHLRVLERAHLVTTRRSGREKLHFLNPVPIQLISERWTSKYAEPFASAMTALKRTLEEDHVAQTPVRDLHPHQPRKAVGRAHRR
jgi:DNA-binding transcriptional ArsR family regulator